MYPPPKILAGCCLGTVQIDVGEMVFISQSGRHDSVQSVFLCERGHRLNSNPFDVFIISNRKYYFIILISMRILLKYQSFDF